MWKADKTIPAPIRVFHRYGAKKWGHENFASQFQKFSVITFSVSKKTWNYSLTFCKGQSSEIFGGH